MRHFVANVVLVSSLSSALVNASEARAAGEPAARAEPEAERRVHVSVETDPVPIVFHGFAAAVGVKPTPHWKIAAEALSIRFPSFIADATGNAGWTVRATGGMATGEFFPSDAGRGLFLGMVVSIFDWSLTAPSGGASTDAQYLELTPHVGYQLFIPHTGLFVAPWAGVAVPIKLGGSTSAGGQTFSQAPILPFAVANVGYEF